VSKDHLYDRQRDVALHQLHRPRPADDLRRPGFARHSDGLGPLIEFSARMGRIELEQTSSGILRGKGFQGTLNLGRHPFRYLDFTAGPIFRTGSFTKQNRMSIRIEIFLQIKVQNLIEARPRVADQQKDKKDPLAGGPEIRAARGIRPLSERLLEPVEQDGVQTSARTRAGQDTGVIRYFETEVSSAHNFRPHTLSGPDPPGSWRVAHRLKIP